MRSFIKPRKKKLFDDMSLLWVLFITLVTIGLIVFAVILHRKSSFYIKMLDNLGQRNGKQIKEVKSLQQRIAMITAQGKIYDEVNRSNIALKESMQNLFDLIPDQITLSKVVMKKESLYLKGYAASKEAYALLLEPPLKSIFTQTKVKFTRDAKGRLIFESLNSIADMSPKREGENNATQ